MVIDSDEEVESNDIDLLVSDNVVVDVNDGGDSDDSMPGLMEFDDGDDSDKEFVGQRH